MASINKKRAVDIAHDKKRADIIANRIMTVIIVCFVLMISLVFLGRGYNIIKDNWSSTQFILNALVISVPSIMLAGALLYLFRSMAKKQSHEDRVMAPSFVLLICAVVFILGIAIRIDSNTVINASYIILPVLTVLYIVYYSFQRECFAIAMAIAVGAVLMYALYKVCDYVALAPFILPICIVLAVVALAFGAFMFRASKKSGQLGIFGSKVKLAESDGTYFPCYIYAVIAAVSFVAIGLYGKQIAYYSVFATAACAILAGLFYTIKLAQKS